MYRSRKVADQQSVERIFQISENNEYSIWNSSQKEYNRDDNEFRFTTKKLCFILDYMNVILTVTGLNDSERFERRNSFKCNMAKVLFYAWNVILAVQIISFVSQTTNSKKIRDIKLYISVLLLHSSHVLFRIMLIHHRWKFTNLMLNLHNLKSLKVPQFFIYLLLSFTGYVFVNIIFRNTAWFHSKTAEKFNFISDDYFFRMRWKNYPRLLPAGIIFLWITTETIFQSFFAIMYVTTCYILKREFDIIAEETKRCKTMNSTIALLKNYKRALEVGKTTEDALSSSLFFAFTYMLTTLFHRGYEIFTEENVNIYQVSCFNCLSFVHRV